METNTNDFEAVAYPNVPANARAVLCANRDLIRRFLASDLGRMEARSPDKKGTDKPETQAAAPRSNRVDVCPAAPSVSRRLTRTR